MTLRYPPRTDLEFDEGRPEFAESRCIVCGEPGEIRVRWWETHFGPGSSRVAVRGTRSESRYFCAGHRAVAERVYASLSTRRPIRA